jgi:hypothetical protein
MKKNISRGSVRATKGKGSAENKDRLDSRRDEEQDFKGNDVTHNQKVIRKKKSSKREGE